MGGVVPVPNAALLLLDRLEQVAQRRHRAIVQIRGAQPDAVEERGDIAVERIFHETFALEPHVSHHLVGRNGGLFVPALEPIAIGADLRDGNARAGSLARMALRAVRVEQRFASRCFRVVDGKREFGRTRCPEVLVQPFHVTEEIIFVVRRRAEQTHRRVHDH